MDNILKAPQETATYVAEAGEKRCNKSIKKLLIQGIFAGMFIAMGAIGYFKLVVLTEDHGLGLFLGALIFPTGIIAVAIAGAELFTSDCMGLMSVLQNKVKLSKFFGILMMIWLFNFIGALFMAGLSLASGIYSPGILHKIMHVSDVKVHLPVIQLIMSGILCNIMVCVAVWMSYSAKDGISKIFLLWFPITLFVISGTEHVVANMYYLLTAFLAGGDITLFEIFRNLFFVTIGNFIGGGIIITCGQYFSLVKD